MSFFQTNSLSVLYLSITEAYVFALNWCVLIMLFLKLEALKEQNKIVKKQERAAKRKEGKEAASAGVEPAAKKAKKVRKV